MLSSGGVGYSDSIAAMVRLPSDGDSASASIFWLAAHECRTGSDEAQLQVCDCDPEAVVVNMWLLVMDGVGQSFFWLAGLAANFKQAGCSGP